MLNIKNIKLVIWDLDDTFWNGTLSEGSVMRIESNIELLRDLVDAGIMCSICSKNNHEQAQRTLLNMGVWEYFVFPSIDWTSKAERIKQIISDMALRPVNCLFVDDNALNLQEVKYYIPEINILETKDLVVLSHLIFEVKGYDLKHTRLLHYKNLEKKIIEKKTTGDNIDFLIQSHIKIKIDQNCSQHIERIVELVNRTNQLNYTKVRSTKEEILILLNNPDFNCATVHANDKYGDYGLVGFYALNRKEFRLVHFLFSCRTLGMGIEQFVYEKLDYPSLCIAGNVTTNLLNKKVVTWIDESEDYEQGKTSMPKLGHNTTFRVLLKGPCDLDSIIPYIGQQSQVDIQTEFNHPNKDGVAITAMNDSIHVIHSYCLTENDKKALIFDAPFLDESAFKTRLFSEEWDIVFYSLLPDCHEAVYQHKTSKHCICFSSANFNLTSSTQWPYFMNGSYNNHGFKFTKEILQNFRENFDYIGHPSIETIVNNLKEIIAKLPSKTQIYFILGSETECKKNVSIEFSNQALFHQKVNKAVKISLGQNKQVGFINLTNYVTSQYSFGDNTNHFKRPVYYALAQTVMRIIKDNSKETNLQMMTRWQFWRRLIRIHLTSLLSRF